MGVLNGLRCRCYRICWRVARQWLRRIVLRGLAKSRRSVTTGHEVLRWLLCQIALRPRSLHRHLAHGGSLFEQVLSGGGTEDGDGGEDDELVEIVAGVVHELLPCSECLKGARLELDPEFNAVPPDE